MTLGYVPELFPCKLNYDASNIMEHGLAHRPASIFDDREAMKVAKTKPESRSGTESPCQEQLLHVSVSDRDMQQLILFGLVYSTMGRAIAYM